MPRTRLENEYSRFKTGLKNAYIFHIDRPQLFAFFKNQILLLFLVDIRLLFTGAFQGEALLIVRTENTQNIVILAAKDNI